MLALLKKDGYFSTRKFVSSALLDDVCCENEKELLEEFKDKADKGNIDEIKAIASDVIENEEKIIHHSKGAYAIVKGMLQHSRQAKGIKEPINVNTLCDDISIKLSGFKSERQKF